MMILTVVICALSTIISMIICGFHGNNHWKIQCNPSKRKKIKLVSKAEDASPQRQMAWLLTMISFWVDCIIINLAEIDGNDSSTALKSVIKGGISINVIIYITKITPMIIAAAYASAPGFDLRLLLKSMMVGSAVSTVIIGALSITNLYREMLIITSFINGAGIIYYFVKMHIYAIEQLNRGQHDNSMIFSKYAITASLLLTIFTKSYGYYLLVGQSAAVWIPNVLIMISLITMYYRYPCNNKWIFYSLGAIFHYKTVFYNDYLPKGHQKNEDKKIKTYHKTVINEPNSNEGGKYLYHGDPELEQLNIHDTNNKDEMQSDLSDDGNVNAMQYDRNHAEFEEYVRFHTVMAAVGGCILSPTNVQQISSTEPIKSQQNQLASNVGHKRRTGSEGGDIKFDLDELLDISADEVDINDNKEPNDRDPQGGNPKRQINIRRGSTTTTVDIGINRNSVKKRAKSHYKSLSDPIAKFDIFRYK